MNLSIKAASMGHKHLTAVIRSGRTIPYNLEASLRDGDSEKVKTLADPSRIDLAYTMVLEGAESEIQTIEKRNWYHWAKPRGRKTSADLGAENVFKAFYQGEPLTDEERVVVLGALAIQIEEELNELKKERNIIKI